MANPYFIGDQPGGTQTSGWLDAWTSAPSVYAVAARNAADVAAAVDFARENDLRLVVKGGGHSYQGTSNAPDSLLVWTRDMRAITPHDAFVPKGCRDAAPRPAVSLEAGTRWLEAYEAVTTRAGRYVQGGGCATVGVAGLIQSGGFGSFSKNFGMAAAGLLEAEVVTADGMVRIANACTHPDLFWGLKGGGGGSLGIVTRVTLATHDLPENFGAAEGRIQAKSDAAFRRLIGEFVRFYREGALQSALGRAGQLRDRQLAQPEFRDAGARALRGAGRVEALPRLRRGLSAGFRVEGTARGLDVPGEALVGRRVPEGARRELGPFRRPPRRSGGQRLLGRQRDRGQRLRLRL